MDGNTPGGQRPVVVEFTEDEARQVIRSVEWERMMAGDVDRVQPKDEDMRKAAERRAFINQILDKIYEEVKRQL